MTRGTTPTCVFTLPFLASALSSWYITFAQRGAERFTMAADACTSDGFTIRVTLTQADTLKLEAGTDVEVQLRGVVLADGSAIASEIVRVPVLPVLKEGAIS